ncbi:MAG: Rpn family recombination-promoting nuclease/putative transposase, partial [Candidatus Magnetoovum sp. WYHC-5]|nr:Rpn family recombination-promoting nuclease/putative transposase [Candidatus Magnetoovum sp. WYHC-5]
IGDITILNPYQAPKLAELKETTLDIRAVNKKGVTFIIEIKISLLFSLPNTFLKAISLLTSTKRIFNFTLSRLFLQIIDIVDNDIL